MADILLKYLTDLPSASSAEIDDLMHINQDGNDRSVTIAVLLKAMVDGIYPTGSVHFFADNTNPNAVWSGTTWARVPGAGKTVRIASENGVDIFQEGGSDNVTLTEDNIPSHQHEVDLESQVFDHGTKTTASSGAHTHNISLRVDGATSSTNYNDVHKTGSGSTVATSSAGNHTHTLAIGAHKHKVIGSTQKSGQGKSIGVANSYIKLAAWYRVS